MDRLISEKEIKKWLHRWIGYLDEDMIARMEMHTKDIPSAEIKYCDRNICLRNEYNGIGCSECEVTKSQEPKTDERKEALRELKQEYRHHQYNNSDSCYGWSTSFKQAVAVAIKCLSAEQNTGHWIAQDIYNCHTVFKCSECGYIHNFMHLYGEPTADYTYCPNCGAKMVEPQESEVNNG